MSLTKEIPEKKVNFEFNKEFINVLSKKIKDNDTAFLNRTLKELHPSDSADLIENPIGQFHSPGDPPAESPAAKYPSRLNLHILKYFVQPHWIGSHLRKHLIQVIHVYTDQTTGIDLR